jgi:hypothetical protein
MALPKLEGLIRIAEATVLGTLTTGATPYVITIPVGDYYLTTAGNGARSLVDEIEEQVEAMVGAGTCTVTVDDDTDTSEGQVTIAYSATFTLSWTSTYLRDLLGFTGTLTPAASSFQGTGHARTLWLPNCGRSNTLAPEGSNGHIQSDYTCVIAPSGAHRAFSFTARYSDTMNFAMVQGRKAWIEHESRAGESFEQFYLDVLQYAYSVRYYLDRSTASPVADTDYKTWFVKDGGRYEPVPVVSNWTGEKSLWSFTYEVGKDVT